MSVNSNGMEFILCNENLHIFGNDQGPLLLQWFNFDTSRDK